MKMKQILSEKEAKKIQSSDTECSLCVTHERAYKKIPNGIICPYCGHNHREDGNFIVIPDYKVVGQHNAYDPEEEIAKYPVFNCDKCGEHIALIPEKVMWNGNHDVYYTGGKHYFPHAEAESEIFQKVQAKMEAHLKQWVERYEAGDKVSTSNVALWLRRDIESAIAEFLFEKGFKK